MHAMKKEMLPILARIPEIREVANTLKLAIMELDIACGNCDGSSNSVDAVRDAADAVSSAGAECASHAKAVTEGAHRSCDRLN